MALLRCIYEAVDVYRSRWELAEDVPAIEREWRGRKSDPLAAYWLGTQFVRISLDQISDL